MRLLALAFLAGLTGAASAEPTTGRYAPIDLVVDGAQVRGLFSDWRGGNGTDAAPQFSCIFFLHGRFEGEAADVLTWFPGEDARIGGVMRVTPGGISVQLEENHGGCVMTAGDMVRAPFEASLDEARTDWIDLGLVTAERAVLQRGPAREAGRTRPYLVSLDPVAVLERRDGWARVEYSDGNAGTTGGWLPEADLAFAGEAPQG